MAAADPMPQFVEDFALAMAGMGFPRMPARIFTLLLSAPEESLTARDLAARLEVSAAAVSGGVRYLEQIKLMRRTRARGERVDRFGLSQNVWEPVMHAEVAAYGPLIELCDRALTHDELPDRGRERVTDTRDFLAFLAAELPRIWARWMQARD